MTSPSEYEQPSDWRDRWALVWARWRWRMVSGLVLLAVGLGAALFWYVGGTEKRTLANAAKFVQAGDWRRAAMLLEQAVRAHPDHLAVCRAWAEFLDRLGIPES